MHERFWVYILSSTSGTLYTGMTNNLDRRIFEHKHHLTRGFTATYDCTRLVWFEEWQDVRSAIAREKQIKGWLRSKKIALIQSFNPHWTDLAEHWSARLCDKVGISSSKDI
jgi:putative endonuclease